VDILAANGKHLGRGIYNSQSQITVRRYTRGRENLDAALIEKRLRDAISYRERWAKAGKIDASACRLFWSESDGLPGLVVDRYGTVLVIQTLTLAMAMKEEEIAGILGALLRPDAIIARDDAPVRQLEGLPLEKKIVTGNYRPPTALAIAGLPFELDLLNGQKTGFYLDQVPNYERLAAYAPGRRVLDCFANQGAFGLACLRAGAVSCLAIDQSEEALHRGQAVAARLGLPMETQAANAFDMLPQLASQKGVYDLVILDPPSFTKSKAQLESALRGYKELQVRALRILPPGGILATFCCSHHVGDVEWEGMLAEAAGDAQASMRVTERLGQGLDHPALLEVPETRYLRGCILEKLS